MATIFLLILLAGFQTTMATEKDWIVTLKAKINGPNADQVWPIVADFCNLYKAYPCDVSFCVSGSEGKPGQTRYIVEKYPSPSNPNTTVVKWLREELVKIDAKKRSETHIVRANNKGLTKFSATVQILPRGDKGSTFKWSVVSAPIVGMTYNDFVGKLKVIVSDVVDLIQKKF